MPLILFYFFFFHFFFLFLLFQYINGVLIFFSFSFSAANCVNIFHFFFFQYRTFVIMTSLKSWVLIIHERDSHIPIIQLNVKSRRSLFMVEQLTLVGLINKPFWLFLKDRWVYGTVIHTKFRECLYECVKMHFSHISIIKKYFISVD